jgi:DNA-binding LacI/PurR family transcriptional regulator
LGNTPCNANKAEFWSKDFPAIVKTWIAEPPRQRPTAMFAVGEAVIGPVIVELAKHGLRVPRDISIVAVTSNHRLWSGGEPVVEGVRLTSVDVNLSALAQRTIDAAIELADEKRNTGAPLTRSPKLTLAPAHLALGESTAAPRRIL